MSIETPEDLQHRIAAALDCIPSEDAEQRLMPHICWLLRQIFTAVEPEDLLPSEAMTILAAASPAHARVLGIPSGGRPILRIVPGA